MQTTKGFLFSRRNLLQGAAAGVLSVRAVRGAGPVKEWKDPETGRWVRRLTSLPGHNTGFYFHQNPYSADSKSIVFMNHAARTHSLPQADLWALDLETYETRPLTTDGRMLANTCVVSRARNEALYFHCDNSLWSVHLTTGLRKMLHRLPTEWRTAGPTTSCDGKKLVAAFDDRTKAPPSFDWAGTYAAKLENTLFSIDLETGKYNEFFKVNTWLGHTQFSPTDPTLLSYCYEGPWDSVPARIWLIRADGTGNHAARERQSKEEGWGHEFWLPDGRRIMYDLWTSRKPATRKRYLGVVDVDTRAETLYSFADEHWSTHFTVSRDGKLFAGDGSVRSPYIFLIRLEGSEARFEKLCGIPKLDWGQTEPCPHITPDGTGVIFTSNEGGANNLYLVRI